jgi:hypothetical protein
VSSNIGTASNYFTWDAPLVSYFLPNNAHSVLKGASITFHGIDFGTLDWTASARLGDSLGFGHCRTTAWTSRSSIICSSGYGYGQSYRSAVTVAGLLGTSSTTFTYQGCGCPFEEAPWSSTSGRCTSDSQCACSSGYGGLKCRACDTGYGFDPFPCTHTNK